MRKSITTGRLSDVKPSRLESPVGGTYHTVFISTLVSSAVSPWKLLIITPQPCHLRLTSLALSLGSCFRSGSLQTSSLGRLSGLDDLEDMARPIVVASNGVGDNSVASFRHDATMRLLASLPTVLRGDEHDAYHQLWENDKLKLYIFVCTNLLIEWRCSKVVNAID